MSKPDETKILKWLRRQLSEDITEDGAVARFELWHATESSMGDRLATCPVVDSIDADDLTAEIVQAAQDDAETRTTGLPQRYVVAAYRGLDDRDVMAQMAFVLEGGGHRAALKFSDTYPATEAGERAMGMGHHHDLHRMLFAQSQYISDTNRQDLERERKRRIQLEERHLDLMRSQEDLLDRQHERNIRQAKEDARAKRLDKIMDMGMKMLPFLLMQISGRKSPTAAGARDTALHDLLKSLSEAEVMGILNAVSEEKKAAIMALYMEHAAEEREEQSEKHPLLRDSCLEIH